MANTSGQGSTIAVPEEIKGWNWGAFFLTLIWGASNKVWSSALVGVPGIGALVPFVLGFKGNEWAWQNKEWESVEHFQQVQRKWAYWGCGVFVVCIVIFFAISLQGGFDNEDEEAQYEVKTTHLSRSVSKSVNTEPAAQPSATTEPVIIASDAPKVSSAAAVAPAVAVDAPKVAQAPDASNENLVAETAPPRHTNATRKKYATVDLRECFNYQTNEDIARCAERF